MSETSDRPTIVLFDVDGTLVTTAGAGREAFDAAFADVFGRDHGLLDFSFAGLTDPLLVRRGLEASDEPVDDETIEAMVERYLERLPDALRDRDGYRIHPGVPERLEAVRRRPSTAVGLGTGNVERGARLKLARGDIADGFEFGGFGSDATRRADLLRVGFRRGADRLGSETSTCRLVVVGDTPRDVAAARDVGADVAAVATGGADESSLRDANPDLLVEDLTDPRIERFLAS